MPNYSPNILQRTAPSIITLALWREYVDSQIPMFKLTPANPSGNRMLTRS